LVEIHLRVLPKTARIRLDGAVQRSAVLSLPRSTEHQLVIQAPGYVSESRRLHAERDGDVEIVLRRAKAETKRTKKRYLGPLEDL
jgi:hypothetical protein